jgi:lysozyme
MKISQKGIALIKSFEGCYLKAYKCPASVWTIGYGTTEPINGVAIHDGMTITQEQAEEALTNHLKRYENAVNNLGVQFNQNQFDALVSFCYNLGTGIFKGSLLTAIKANDWQSVASQMLLYNKARVNGELTVLKGLDRRRKAEVALFNSKCEEVKQDDELSAAVSKIIKSGIQLDYNSWKRVDLINLNNVPELIIKLGGVDNLVGLQVIGNKEMWLKKQYNANNVRSLLIKYSIKLS